MRGNQCTVARAVAGSGKDVAIRATFFSPLAIALVSSALAPPLHAGDVAMETLKIQNEGFARDSGSKGRGGEVTHAGQQGGASKFIPEKDGDVIVGFEPGPLKGSVKPDRRSKRSNPAAAFGPQVGGAAR